MVTIGMSYRVREGQEGVFEAAFDRVLTALGDLRGHADTSLFRRVGSPREYLIVSRWSDEAAFQGFIRSEAFAKVTRWGSEHVLEAPPSHTTYREA